MKPYIIAIGKTIRKFREAKDFSQTELAMLALGYSKNGSLAGQKKISKFECGKQEPRISELLAIARALGIDLDTFIKHIFKIHSYTK